MRNCFGTFEFLRTSAICMACEDYGGCRKVAPKRDPITSTHQRKRLRKLERLGKQAKG
jgi:hypothetical protein